MNSILFEQYGKSGIPILTSIGDGSVACWGIRKLRSAYSGYCIKVRRSSDDTTLNVGFSGDNLDTSSLLSFVGAGNGLVETIYDQSGNGWNLLQTTLINQPSIVTSGTLNTRGGKTVIKFDGVNDIMTVPTSTAAFVNIHYNKGFVSGVFGVTTLNTNGYKGLFGNCTDMGGHVGFFLLYDDRSSFSLDENCNFVAKTTSGSNYSIICKGVNGLFANNIAIINIGLDNQNSNSQERGVLYGNNASSSLINTQSSISSSANSTNDFCIGSETLSVGARYDLEFQELILFTNDQKKYARSFRNNQNNYYNIY